MPYVYSTSTADINFHVFAPASNHSDGKPRKILKTIVIQGGANLLTRKSVYTPAGVGTQVSLEDLTYLETDATFNDMKKNGFFLVHKSKKDANTMAKDLQPKDKSAPSVDSDFKRDNLPEPSVGSSVFL